MRDWEAFVRAHLPLDDCEPGPAHRVIRELAAHLEDLYRDALAGGAAEPEAEARATAAIPDWARLAEDLRRAHSGLEGPRLDRLVARVEAKPANRRGGRLRMVQVLRDVRYACRQLASAPGFTAVAIVTLATGIGATTAMFSVINGVLLRPLPYADDSRLVRVFEVVPQYGRFSVAPANFLDWRQQNHVFERIAAYAASGATFLTSDGPDRVQGLAATADLFPTLGVRPLLGTVFTADDEKPGAEAVVVLSYRAWQQRFGGDPSVLQRAVSMNGQPARVVGVMPPDFYFPTRTPEFWQPLTLDPAKAPRGAHFLGVVARLRADADVTRATTEMQTIATRLSQQYPDASPNESAEIVPVREQVVGAVRPALFTLFGAVAVVVLIACMNIAHLQLVRASSREKEMAIRAALGASRRRLLGQMLAESLVLATVGGAAGILLGYVALAPIRTLGALSIPRVADVTLDGRVILFAAAVSCLTALLFGLAPAWRAARSASRAVLTDRSGVGTTALGGTMRSTLLVIEVALSLVLLTGAVLLLRSFSKLTHVDPGFTPRHVLAFQVALPERNYPDDERRLAFFDRLTTNLGAAPGVETIGLVQTLPLAGSYVLAFDIRGRVAERPGESPSANYRVVSPRYFDTLRIPVKRGRAFTNLDRAGSEPVAIVDEAFVRKFLPGEEPLGRAVRVGNGMDIWAEIVGVVGDVRQLALDSVGAPTIYLPLRQDAFAASWVLVRTSHDPQELTAVARREVRALDATLPAYSLKPLDAIVQETIAPQRFSTLLLTLFAAVAVFLSAVGLYGVMACTVTQRTREIGVRMAMGAAPADVWRLIVGRGMRLALIGIALGVASAAMLSRLVEAMLFEVQPSDPPSYVATILLLLLVTALACYIPARRAMRVNPLVAMRDDGL